MSIVKTNTLLGVRYTCRHSKCYRDFGTIAHMESHLLDMHSNYKFSCDQCDESFSRKNELGHHVAVKHIATFTCPFKGCNEKRFSIQSLNYHTDTPSSSGGHDGKRKRNKPIWELIK